MPSVCPDIFFSVPHNKCFKLPTRICPNPSRNTVDILELVSKFRIFSTRVCNDDDKEFCNTESLLEDNGDHSSHYNSSELVLVLSNKFFLNMIHIRFTF